LQKKIHIYGGGTIGGCNKGRENMIMLHRDVEKKNTSKKEKKSRGKTRSSCRVM